jgi:hypothetical protein
MIGLNTFNEQEVEVFTDKFQTYTSTIRKIILESNLFTNETGENDDNVKTYRFYSKYKSNSHNYQFWIGWEEDDDWEGFMIGIPTKKVIKESMWGTKYEYSSFFYHPVYSKKQKYDSVYENSTYEVFKNKLDNGLVDINEEELEFINKLNNIFVELIHQVKNESNLKNRIHSENINSSISEVDKDNNGEVDLIDGESFNKLLNKHQKSVTEIDKNYIQKFVKISMYLKTKKKNTQNIFESISETRNGKELDELMSLLKNQIHTYELLVFHSISMITSLVESDLITFYEIYESFDQLGVFNSNWENEVSNKLNDIGDGIKDLMYSINRMELNIVNSLETLTYVTEDSFNELNSSISSQLSSIDSSINFNNLLTGIQTYQMYKINQNSKRVN